MPPSKGTKLTAAKFFLDEIALAVAAHADQASGCWENRPARPARRRDSIDRAPRGNRIARRGEDDRVERRLVRPAELAVVMTRTNVVRCRAGGNADAPGATTPRCVRPCKPAAPAGQHHRLITRAGADLQHFLRRPSFIERFEQAPRSCAPPPTAAKWSDHGRSAVRCFRRRANAALDR